MSPGDAKNTGRASGASPSQRAHRRLPRVLRIVRARPRLFIAVALGTVVGVALPAEWRPVLRMLVGWDACVAIYLALALRAMADCDVARVRRRAAQLDEDRIAFLVLPALAALASLGAIVAELGAKEAAHAPAHLALALATIILSWAFTHTIFALHYAHEFYSGARPEDGGLAFPGKQQPDYWDFLYFSLVIGMTSQVSDVAVTAKSVRRTVAAHGVLSFFFNATLLALMVNIAAGALAG
jgi:uncharacterized membrane protein